MMGAELHQCSCTLLVQDCSTLSDEQADRRTDWTRRNDGLARATNRCRQASASDRQVNRQPERINRLTDEQTPWGGGGGQPDGQTFEMSPQRAQRVRRLLRTHNAMVRFQRHTQPPLRPFEDGIIHLQKEQNGATGPTAASAMPALADEWRMAMLPDSAPPLARSPRPETDVCACQHK
jgi:hypothetical protein